MKAQEWFDRYLRDELDESERAIFELRLSSDDVFKKAFEEHKLLVQILGQVIERKSLRIKLNKIHEQEFGKDAKIISINRPEKLTKRIGRTFMVAASAAIVAVLSTVAILSTGGYLLKKQNGAITDLKREVTGLKYSQTEIIKKIHSKADKRSFVAANLEGSAFAINNDGYIITSWHMVSGADSIFIENQNVYRSLAKVIFNDPSLDVAILKVEDESVYSNWSVPFSFGDNVSEIGEVVYTLGYPRKDMVYGEGSLSALSGYNNDTTMYQVSIPVNPGNSGGPLIDESGKVIGLIRGKMSSAEGTGFAIKSSEILRSVKALDTDTSKSKIVFNKAKSNMKRVKRSDQIKRINPYVFNVLVYKNS